MFRDSLSAITDERLFSSERGYQGRLVAELINRLNVMPIFPGDPVVEQEYQKTLRNHGIRIRPDIIIHIPFERGQLQERSEGNFIVIQLKRNSTKRRALDDFNNIDLMFERLNYPIGIFLNIDSENNFFNNYQGNYPDRLHCFAVRLDNNEVIVEESP
jgi:hypothetical protein